MTKQERVRLDVAVAKRAAVSRERAQGLILGGHVKVDGVAQRKAGLAVALGAVIEIQREERYVSRGGYKLERALQAFAWSPAGLRCLDVGASTGGFTDCLLQHGAASVSAVDVGYGHLAWQLRQDPRVMVVERTNFRHADLAKLGAPFDFACADVSFISLTKLAAQLANALRPQGCIVALVKPQFEAGRAAVERGGVVRASSAQIAAIHSVIVAFEDVGLTNARLAYSPIKGPAGNIEFLLGAVCTGAARISAARTRSSRQAVEPVERARPLQSRLDAPLDVAGVVREAHEALQ